MRVIRIRPEQAGFRYSYRCRRCSGGWSHSHGRGPAYRYHDRYERHLIALQPLQTGNWSFRFIGYDTETVAIAGHTHVSVTLKENAQAIDNVVITAFGEIKKKDFYRFDRIGFGR